MQIGILLRRFFGASLFVSAAFGATWAQNLTPRSASPPSSISLAVPAGTPLPIVLDKEVRLRKVGQPIHGKIAEPVYAFDKLVVPAGSQVTGRIIAIARVSAQKRTLAALDANLSPYRDVQVSFDDLTLPDGRHMLLQTTVSPASKGVLQFAAAAEPDNQNKRDKKTQAKKLASSKVSEARQEISRNWQTAKQQVKTPGKIHRLERYVIAQLPYHPQYLDAGMRYNAELKQPLDFGNESLSPEVLQDFGSAPPPGSVVHALLATPLSSGI
jgi:hypothetical protein